MSLVLVGVLEDDPRPCAGGTTTMTLAAAAQRFTVVVSSQHAVWVASTLSAGVLVQVDGVLPAPEVVHAWRVQPVVEPVD
jgi:hypothetical protein